MASDIPRDSTADVEVDASGADRPLDQQALEPDSTAVGTGATDSAARDSSAIDSGASDAAPDAQACTGSLSNIGTADFRVSFTVTGATQGGLVALVNQRSACGPSVFWDVRMSGGFIRVEVDDVVNYTNFTTTGVMVNDGRPHDVLIQRSAEVVVAFVDGVESAPFGAKASFGQLAALTVRVDVCASNDMTAALFGTLSNLCVTSP
jgi:hypothetical protein